MNLAMLHHSFRPRPAPPRTARRLVPASCGQLVGGILDGRDLLVNCPVDLFCRASVRSSDRPGLRVRGMPRHPGVAGALALVAGELALDLAHEVAIECAAPRGRGLAAGSAAMLAAAEALCATAGIAISPEALGHLMSLIEPSHGLHHPGIARVDPISGQLLDRFAPPAGLRVLVLDGAPGEQLPPAERERAVAVYRAGTQTLAGALNLLVRSLAAGNLAGIGQAATVSAELAQRVSPLPAFDDLLLDALAAGALGLVRAPERATLGILYRDEPRAAEALDRAVRSGFAGAVAILGDHAVIGGGCRNGDRPISLS